ncbi:MAG: ABC transporter permease [Acidobacteria bacterium]|nr:ABC transporter permease [Acidobacteriota bacterium]
MSELWRRLRMLLSRERFERELEEEIQSHLEMQTGDNQEHGMAPEEARYAARRQFGNAALLKEVSADAWGWRWFEALAQDLRYALRTLRRRPGFTAIAILSLALGIGVNIAIFSFINGVLLRPLPVPEAERMVSIYHRSSKGWLSSSSYPDYTFYRNHNDVFTGMLAYLRVPMLLRTGEVDEKLSGELVSSDYFFVLGLKPVAGRWFGGERGGSAQEQPLVILSYDFWQRRYGHDSAVIGRSLRIGAGSFTVSGVAPPGFHGLVLDWGDPPEFWVPMRMYQASRPGVQGHGHPQLLGHAIVPGRGKTASGRLVRPGAGRLGRVVVQSRAAEAKCLPREIRIHTGVVSGAAGALLARLSRLRHRLSGPARRERRTDSPDRLFESREPAAGTNLATAQGDRDPDVDRLRTGPAHPPVPDRKPGAIAARRRRGSPGRALDRRLPHKLPPAVQDLADL